MATTITPVVGAKKKTGMFTVSIRITHNRVSRYIATNIEVEARQLSKDCKHIKDVYVDDILADKVRTLRKRLLAISDSELYDADMLLSMLTAEEDKKKKVFRLDFFDFGEAQMARKDNGTTAGYGNALRALERFLGRRRLDINDITVKLLTDFRAYLEDEEGKAGCRSVSKYLTDIRTLHNRARREYNDEVTVNIPRSPFVKGLIPTPPPVKHRALTAEQIRYIAALNPQHGRGKIARDIGLLSFCLIGINSADLYFIKKSDLKDGILSYERRKTATVRQDRARMEVRIEDTAHSLVARYTAEDTDSLFVFFKKYATFKDFNKSLNKGLKLLSEESAGVLPPDITYYHFRHSWATIAYSLGIDYMTIHEALNHAKASSEKITDIYIKKDWTRIWEANRMVLEAVFGDAVL